MWCSWNQWRLPLLVLQLWCGRNECCFPQHRFSGKKRFQKFLKSLVWRVKEPFFWMRCLDSPSFAETVWGFLLPEVVKQDSASKVVSERCCASQLTVSEILSVLATWTGQFSFTAFTSLPTLVKVWKIHTKDLAHGGFKRIFGGCGLEYTNSGNRSSGGSQ